VRRSPPKVGRRHKHPEAVRELDLVDGFPNVIFTFEIGAIVGLSITRDSLAVAGRDGMKDTLRFPHRQRAEHFSSLRRFVLSYGPRVRSAAEVCRLRWCQRRSKIDPLVPIEN